MIYESYDSPLGQILLAAEGETLTGLWFSGQKYFPQNVEISTEKRDVLRRSKAWLDRYFAGEDPGPTPPLAIAGTAFQRRVWEKLLEIPYGQTVTYGTLAKQLGIQSAQAVGGAVGRNPISLMIPCHRVVGARDRLTGYAGGLWRKAWLLTWEGKRIEKDQIRQPD